MGCGTIKPKKTTMKIIIDSPPPSLPPSLNIINTPQNKIEFPASQLPVFQKKAQSPNKSLGSYPTHEKNENY